MAAVYSIIALWRAGSVVILNERKRGQKGFNTHLNYICEANQVTQERLRTEGWDYSWYAYI